MQERPYFSLRVLRSAHLFSRFVTYLRMFFFVTGTLMNIFSRKNVRVKVLFTSRKRVTCVSWRNYYILLLWSFHIISALSGTTIFSSKRCDWQNFKRSL